jgi:hypothetical protein
MPAPKKKFTVPEVWRRIVKKSELQGGKRFDVLVCTHAVPSNDNAYRRARSCPECRIRVQQYADTTAAEAAKESVPPAVARPKAVRRRRTSGATRRAPPRARNGVIATRRPRGGPLTPPERPR